ncbi:type II toxin-antitoxin system HipA family toxin [Microcella pacifica]|uniref:Type II toxin-antitoxin system HipA family toxin n=1 Tax=Microcella pacifica TaxID=2591847 RepID=A0A9E5MIE0_9MICO|nr:type II toxin-antitoxin system HipA family toxin [Microcella pacifica]NHF62658.1 type II toxin-antitoxin system HipA family toxin [Microcella pacifica]
MAPPDLKTAEVTVVLPDGNEVLAGVVTDIPAPQASAHRLTFTYAESYLTEPLGYDLSPDMPRMSGPLRAWPNRSELGALADVMPDEWGRRVIRAGTAARTTFDYLVHVNDATRHGAIRIRQGQTYVGHRPHPVASIHSLDQIVSAARAFEDGVETEDELSVLVDAGTSAGGAKPKAVVDKGGELWMAKFARQTDYHDPMAWEATALSLAAQAGIDTPAFELARLGESRSILLTRRFDRDGTRRRGYLSAHSLTTKRNNDASSYAVIAEAIELASDRPRHDTAELFQRVALNLLIGNVDDHFRNHGFLRTATGWSPSPVFDLEPHRRPETVDATPIVDGGEQRGRDIRELRDVHDAFALTRAGAEKHIRHVAEMTQNWKATARQFGISPEAADAMTRAFDGPNRQRALAMGEGRVTGNE